MYNSSSSEVDSRSKDTVNRIIAINTTLKNSYIENDKPASALRRLSIKSWLKENKKYSITYYRDIVKEMLEPKRQEYIEEHEDKMPPRMKFD